MALWNPSLSSYMQICENIKSIAKKCVNLKDSKRLNQTCLNNELFPEYTNIHIYIYIYISIHMLK